MATIDTARAAKTVAFEKLRDILGVRPNSVGIVPWPEGGFALKVVLPRDPGGDMPGELLDVPLEFHVSVQAPSLMSGDGDEPDWLKRSRARIAAARAK